MAFRDTSGQMVVTGTWPNVQVSDPNNLFTSPAVSNTTAGRIASSGVTSGNSAQLLSGVQDALSSMGNLFSSALGSASSGITSSISDLMEMIKKNTDANNAWSAKQATKQNNWQERQNQIAMEFNAAEAGKNRDWQEMMSNTAHQREIADLQAAGLNPVLSASGGNGAAVTSGATASGVTSSGAKGETDTSANSAIAGLMSALISANASMENAKTSAMANIYLGQQQMEMQRAIAELNAGVAYSGQANTYAIAQLNAENQRWMQQNSQSWNELHPDSPWQVMTSVANQAAGPSSSWMQGAVDFVRSFKRLVSPSGKYRKPSTTHS